MNNETKTIKTQKKLKSIEKFETKNLWLMIIRFSMPVFTSMFLVTSFYFFDAYFATLFVTYTPTVNPSYTTDTSALVAAVTPFLQFETSFFIIVVVGASLLFSTQLSKATTTEDYSRILSNGMSTIVIFTILLSTFGIIIAPYYMNWIGNTGIKLTNQMIDDGINYLRIQMGAMVFMAIIMYVLRIIRTEGKVVLSSTIIILPILLNLLLDYLFMGVANMLYIGAAIASFISLFSFTILLFSLIYWMKRNNKTHITFKFKYMRFEREILWFIFIFGIASTMRRLFTSYDSLLFIFGSSNLIGNYREFSTSILKTLNLPFMLSMGLMQVSVLFCNYYYSQNNYDKVKKVLFISMVYLLSLQAIIWTIFIPLIPTFMRIFNVWPAVQQMNYVYAYLIIMMSIVLISFQYLPFTLYVIAKNWKANMYSIIFRYIIVYTSMFFIFYYLQKYSYIQDYQFFYYILATTLVNFVVMLPVFLKQFVNLDSYLEHIKLKTKRTPKIELKPLKSKNGL